MHRAAFHFIQALGIPSLTKKKKKQVRHEEDSDSEDANADDEVDVNVSMDVDASADDLKAMAATMVVDFEPGDTLGKVLAFVNQVQVSSEGVRESLADSCHLHNCKPLELRL
jgi:hypothetical protein